MGFRPSARRCCSSVRFLNQMASPVPPTSRRASRFAIFAAASAPWLTISRRTTLTCHRLPRASRSRRRSTVFSNSSAPFWMSNACAPGVRVSQELVRRDELVLGAGDHVRKTRGGVLVARHVVVDEVRELGPKLAEQEPLADLVEHIRAIGEADLGTVIREDAVAERVEVVDPQAAGRLKAERLLEPIEQLSRRPGRCKSERGCSRARDPVESREQVSYPLDDNRRLARAGTGEHHQRPLAPFDRGALVRR